MRCLYLTPLKPPDHPTPSGDRLIARQFRTLLSRFGYDVRQASVLRTRCATPEALPGIAAAADLELQRILAEEAREQVPPGLVFTYHNYYKAPDLIGPRLAAQLRVPYVIAEASRSPRRANGPYAAGHTLSEAASDAACLILSPTQHDLVALEAARAATQKLVHLPPFLDLAEWPQVPLPTPKSPHNPVRLLTVAMMRKGYKTQSYLALAKALAGVGTLNWALDIVGDGELRREVEAAFVPLGNRVRFHGAVTERDALVAFYRNADLFVWPAIDEPFGMVFLEAAANGVPALAHGYRGVPDVVADGVSGVVVPPGNVTALRIALSELISDPARCAVLADGARTRFQERHGMEVAMSAVSAAFQSAGVPLHQHLRVPVDRNGLTRHG